MAILSALDRSLLAVEFETNCQCAKSKHKDKKWRCAIRRKKTSKTAKRGRKEERERERETKRCDWDQPTGQQRRQHKTKMMEKKKQRKPWMNKERCLKKERTSVCKWVLIGSSPRVREKLNLIPLNDKKRKKIEEKREGNCWAKWDVMRLKASKPNWWERERERERANLNHN